MAGVGFELKKLFKEKGYFSNIKGYFISTLITAGPTVLCILLISSMQFVLSYFGEAYTNVQLFMATIIYCFAFSLIVTGGIAMLAARYASDCIYEKKIEKIFPSMLGLIIIVLVLVFLTGGPFLAFAHLSTSLKLISYIIFAELSIIWIQAVYLTAVKHYIQIATIFFSGVLIMFLVFFILFMAIGLQPTVAALIAIAIGFLEMVLLFFVRLYAVYGMRSFNMADCMEVIKSMDKYPQLLVMGLFYYLGMYGHNFIFWFSKHREIVSDTYIISSFYDVPVFYAFLTVIPVTVLFVIKVETAFYDKYKEYYAMAGGWGTVNDIKRARTEMISTLSTELRYMIEVQFFITFAAIVIGMRLLPQFGLSMLSTDIFSILALGSFAYITMYLVLIILLYFDDRKGAMSIALVFFATSVGFTAISLILGESYYGFGFFGSALISMLMAFIRLYSFLKEIDYHTFAAQPMFVGVKVGGFTRLYNSIFKVGGDNDEKK